MISKVLCLVALAAMVVAYEPYYGHGHHGHSHHGHHNDGHHDHGHHSHGHSAPVHHHAHSEQKFNRHDGHQEKVVYHKHGHHGHHDEHSHGHEHVEVDYHAHPKYEFEYKVEDHHTGDIKSQHEARDGSHTKGYYGLHQPDGHERHVHYQDVDKSGFQAEVKYKINHIIPHHHHH